MMERSTFRSIFLSISVLLLAMESSVAFRAPVTFPKAARAAYLPRQLPFPLHSSQTSSNPHSTPVSSSTINDSNKNHNQAEDYASLQVSKLTPSLIKSIVGGAILGLPAGMAHLSAGDHVSWTIFPVAIAIICFCGALNAYSFRLLGEVCAQTSATTYLQAWSRSVGPKYAKAIAGVVSLKTCITCLAYLIILADSVSSLSGLDRTEALWGVTTVAVLPLCLQRDLSALAPFSFVGVAGMVTAVGTIVLRCVDGTYAPQAEPLSVTPVDPLTGSTSMVDASTNVGVESAQQLLSAGIDWNGGILLAVTLATAFVAHYNAPRFHAELPRDRFAQVTNVSYGFSAVLYCIVAIAGFLTFGDQTQGMILNNYAITDPIVNLSKFAVTIAVLLGFPLPFFGLRDGFLDLFQLRPPQTNGGETDDGIDRIDTVDLMATAGLLFLITTAATFLDDLSLVLAVGGGSFSTLVSSVLPTIMYRSMLASSESSSETTTTTSTASESDWTQSGSVALAAMLVSVSIGSTGVYLALQRAFA